MKYILIYSNHKLYNEILKINDKQIINTLNSTKIKYLNDDTLIIFESFELYELENINCKILIYSSEKYPEFITFKSKKNIVKIQLNKGTLIVKINKSYYLLNKLGLLFNDYQSLLYYIVTIDIEVIQNEDLSIQIDNLLKSIKQINPIIPYTLYIHNHYSNSIILGYYPYKSIEIIKNTSKKPYHINLFPLSLAKSLFPDIKIGSKEIKISNPQYYEISTGSVYIEIKTDSIIIPKDNNTSIVILSRWPSNEIKIICKKYQIYMYLLSVFNKNIFLQGIRGVVNMPKLLTPMSLSTICSNYSVSLKADGERVLLLFNHSLDNYISLLNYDIIPENYEMNHCYSLFDCEKVDDIFYCFDTILYKGINLLNHKLSYRYSKIILNHSNIKIKPIYIPYLDNQIWKLSKKIYNKNIKNDGLIFTSLNNFSTAFFS